MIKKKISIYFLFVSVFTAITIFSVIVQKSYSNLVNSNQTEDVTSLLNKVNPNLDTSIIQEIENRPEVVDSGEINFVGSEDQDQLPVETINEATTAASSIN